MSLVAVDKRDALSFCYDDSDCGSKRSSIVLITAIFVNELTLKQEVPQYNDK